jgi:hypothetical protein
LPKKTRQELIEEMTSYIITANKAAMQSPVKQPMQPNAAGDSSIVSYSSALQRSAPEGSLAGKDSALDTALKALNAHNQLTGVSTAEEATMYSAVPSHLRPITVGEVAAQEQKSNEKEFANTPGGGKCPLR